MHRRVMEQQILDTNGYEGQKAWAFGLGLERLAMVLFSIPDIRLFWTEDQRFLKQFKAGNLKARSSSPTASSLPASRCSRTPTLSHVETLGRGSTVALRL